MRRVRGVSEREKVEGKVEAVDVGGGKVEEVKYSLLYVERPPIMWYFPLHPMDQQNSSPERKSPSTLLSLKGNREVMNSVDNGSEENFMIHSRC